MELSVELGPLSGRPFGGTDFGKKNSGLNIHGLIVYSDPNST